MKILHSFWSKPFFEQVRSPASTEFLLLSFAYSCLQARKFYLNVELVTDDRGLQLLVEGLKLPYTNCTVVLNDLNHYDPELFAIGKVYAYAHQTEPFLHIDNDLFIWERFNDSVQRFPLTVLHKEGYPLYAAGYISALQEIKQKFDYVPKYLADVPLDKEIVGVNAGVMGGTDTEFFKVFSREVFQFIDNNPNWKTMSSPWVFNVIYEQMLFYYLLERKERINFYLDESPQLYSFSEVPGKTRLIHARGDQRGFALRTSLLYFFKTDFPLEYSRICQAIENMAL
jgi:hypothetical protein